MIKLTCRTCGAKLEITEDIDRFSCSFCGNEFIVQRSGGIVNLKPVTDELKKIAGSTKATEATSETTAENTDVLAADVKLKILKEKISDVSERREQIIKRNTSSSGCGCSGCLGFIALSMLIGGLSSFSEDSTAAVIVLIIGVLLAVGTYYAHISDKSSEDEAVKTQIQDIATVNNELEELTKEASRQENRILGGKNHKAE